MSEHLIVQHSYSSDQSLTDDGLISLGSPWFVEFAGSLLGKYLEEINFGISKESLS